MSIQIFPLDKPGSHKSGTLINQSKLVIESVLGFAPNVKDDPCKVKYSWGFTADGKECGIWAWKGSENRGEYSFYGPREVFEALFGPTNVLGG